MIDAVVYDLKATAVDGLCGLSSITANQVRQPSHSVLENVIFDYDPLRPFSGS